MRETDKGRKCLQQQSNERTKFGGLEWGVGKKGPEQHFGSS